jgi:hypothetical protein
LRHAHTAKECATAIAAISTLEWVVSVWTKRQLAGRNEASSIRGIVGDVISRCSVAWALFDQAYALPVTGRDEHGWLDDRSQSKLLKKAKSMALWLRLALFRS